MNISKIHQVKLQEVCEEISAYTHCQVSIMTEGGVIVASSLKERLGKVHLPAADIMAGNIDSYIATSEIAAADGVILEGCTRAIDVGGVRFACVGVAASLDVAEAYATIIQITFQSLFESFLSQSHLENVLKAASMVSIISANTNGLIETFNSGAQRMLGYTAEEVIGKCSPEIFHLKEETVARRKELEELYGEELNDLDAYIYIPRKQGYEEREWTYVRKDGRHINVILGVTAILDDGGDLVGFLGVAKDITLRHRALNELAMHRDHLQELVEERTAKLTESEARFRTFAESLSDWLWEMDENLHFSYFSDGFEKHIGVSSAHFIGKSREDLIDGSIQQEIFAAHLEILKAHKPFSNFTYPYRHPKGHIVYIKVGGEPIFAENGDFKGYRGTGSNVTEAIAAEKALETSERRFKDIAETASDWFWETDQNHRFTFVSDRFFEVADVKREDLLGKSRLELISEARIERNPGKWLKHKDDLENHRSFEIQYWFESRSGSRTCIEISGKPVFDDLGKFEGYRGAGTDVTEAVELQESLKRAKDVAEEANRAKSEFLSNMSHELRTPLNAILGFSQLLENNQKTPLIGNQLDNVIQIRHGGEHLLQLINEILDLSKIEAGKLVLCVDNFDLRPLLDDCIAFSETIASKRSIRLIDETQGKLPLVMADNLRTKQVILNLLSNAIKYNHEDGTVWIQAQKIAQEYLRISIRDNGLGIDANDQDKLFQPFQRLGAETSEVEGTGIGLVLTKKLVEEMNGAIGFESLKGLGSTFWVDIPLAEGGASVEAFREEEKEKVTLHPSETAQIILYVEDNPSNMILMENIIDNIEGLSLISATTAEEGIELAMSEKPDAIILDINLPGMSGIDAVKILKTKPETKDIGVIALSADAMPSTVEEGMKAGFKYYLTKPLDIPKFMDALESTLNS